MSYQIGLGKTKIDFPLIPIAMLGYGNWENRIKSYKTPLHARTFVIKEGENSVVYVNVEIGNIQPAIRNEVVHILTTQYHHIPIREHNLIIVAQHTHSAPGGFSHYSFYNYTNPGFSEVIFSAIVSAIVQSIIQAYNTLFKGTIEFSKGLFPLTDQVAWNRSLKAYNANKNIEKCNDTAQAIDRQMTLLLFKDMEGNVRGSVNWFGVHTTCIGPKNTEASFDGKGYAAHYLEECIPNSIHLFSQAKAGDVSPHYHGVNQNKIRRLVFKKGDHGYAMINGKIQFNKAKELIEYSLEKETINGEVTSILKYYDFTNINVKDSFLTEQGKTETTSEACLGASFFQGTPLDGPGINKMLKYIIILANKVFNKKQKKLSYAQHPKSCVVNINTKEMFGAGKMNVLPNFIDPQVKEMNKQYKGGAIKEHSLVPTVLPLQIIFIGTLAIICVPGEITTIAGAKLEASIKKRVEKKGIKHVIISSYANSYMGYITTTDEYKLQLYEGGHTIFGAYTLGAFQTKFDELIDDVEKDNFEISDFPPVFSKEELSKRSYAVV